MLRQSKVRSLAEAVSLINNGDTVVVCGFNLQNKPMALVREIIRQKKKNLWLVTAGPSSIDADQLIGGGCVRKVASVSISAERFGPIGPCFRRAVQQQSIEIWECEQGIMTAALRGAIQGVPFVPTVAGLGGDFVKVNPDLKVIQDPFEGRPVVAVKTIKPDVALIHTLIADEFGNARLEGGMFFDELAVRAAKKVIVSTENVVPTAVIQHEPRLTRVFSHMTAAVVEVPYGSHPTACHGAYTFDEEACGEYIKAARSGPDGFQEYADKYISGAPTQMEYLNLFGVERLLNIRTKVRVGDI
ncbi:MAG: CoA transferase subunit A [Clostridia bacterium]|nr:MAG: CoA transferase subunit A [Clostridia bacterium]